MSIIRLAEYRLGRNYIRPGDTIRVKRPNHNGYTTTVIAIHGGDTIGIEHRDPRTGGIRVVSPDLVSRKAQTKNGVRKAVARVTSKSPGKS